jgi:L-cysteine desulfidase
LCSFAGTLCDGAKLSCAWKVQSALLIGFQALRLVENNSCLPNNEGLVNKDAFETIKHLGNLSKTIMDSTNNELVYIIEQNIKNI